MSTAVPTAPTCLVRPPWPDELPRIADTFGPARFSRALHPLVLIVTGTPERIVGFAGVLEPVEGRSGLTCTLRPRYLDTPDGDRLITAALQLAESLGARTIRTADDLPPDAPLKPALLRAGFAVEATREIWELSPAALAPRLDRIQRRLEARPDSADLVVEPWAATHLSGVKTLLGAAGLLSSERQYNLEPPAAGYDPGLSFVVRRDQRIVAAALVKRHARAAFLEVVGVDPEYRHRFNSPGCLVLQAVVQACLSAGLPALILAADQERAQALPGKLRRSGGRCRGAIETFIRHIPSGAKSDITSI